MQIHCWPAHVAKYQSNIFNLSKSPHNGLRHAYRSMRFAWCLPGALSGNGRAEWRLQAGMGLLVSKQRKATISAPQLPTRL
jgi:hypothetical protein